MAGCFGFLLMIALVAGGIWFIAWSVEEQKREEAQESAHLAREAAERQRDRAEQERYLSEMTALNQQAMQALETTPRAIEAAERHLDQAETDFAEGAFAPFWDSVERAAEDLGAFQENVQLITSNSTRYVEIRKKYRGNAELFCVSQKSAPALKIAALTSNRMSNIVRRAQRNFEFSVIYEQRKTNQLLVRGFRSLAQALEEMTWRITSSIDELTFSVDSMSSSLNQSLGEIRTHAAKLATAADMYMKDTPARAAREEKVLEMLDNIQRRRHPSILNDGLR